ncbi:DUF4878 domain-containing protein [Longispora albida]|uniref:Rv0361 family membrane protein n=1 Tax=Longispora albida TaxID=203523 RepID=UPI0003766763|nr:DUF4878 domain-containing protein [Longispora albida]
MDIDSLAVAAVSSIAASLAAGSAGEDPVYLMAAARLHSSETGDAALTAWELAPGDLEARETVTAVLASLLREDPGFAFNLSTVLSPAPPVYMPEPGSGAVPVPPALPAPVPSPVQKGQAAFRSFHASVGSGGLAAIAGGIVFYLLVGAMAGVFLVGKDGPDETATEFLEAVAEGDYEGATSRMCRSDQDTQKERDKILSSLQKAAAKLVDLDDDDTAGERARKRAELKKLKFVVTRVEENGDTATVWVKVDHPRVEYRQPADDIPLIREDGDWKVCLSIG